MIAMERWRAYRRSRQAPSGRKWQDNFPNLLRRAAMDIWGDMRRDVREALFEMAMRDMTWSARS